jgi:two-component system, OmpR family, response regulator ChvI
MGPDGRERVLLVEDDDLCREAVAIALSEHGFSVQTFGDGASLLGSLEAAAGADIIILDWSLPQMSGIDLLRELRRQGVAVPVVFLTGWPEVRYEGVALETGAIDFIDKARGIDVLVRRLRLVANGARPYADPVPHKRMVCGKLVLDLAASRAFWNGVDVGITIGEYNIVHLLASNFGRHVTYRALYDRVHYEGFIAGSGDKGYRQNVRSVIKRIRIKFHKLDPTFGEIENCTGFGYRWGKSGAE